MRPVHTSSWSYENGKPFIILEIYYRTPKTMKDFCIESHTECIFQQNVVISVSFYLTQSDRVALTLWEPSDIAAITSTLHFIYLNRAFDKDMESLPNTTFFIDRPHVVMYNQPHIHVKKRSSDSTLSKMKLLSYVLTTGLGIIILTRTRKQST